MLYEFRLALPNPSVKWLSRVVVIIYHVRKPQDRDFVDLHLETALLLDYGYVFFSLAAMPKVSLSVRNTIASILVWVEVSL